jgi:hypothetical protein
MKTTLVWGVTPCSRLDNGAAVIYIGQCIRSENVEDWLSGYRATSTVIDITVDLGVYYIQGVLYL